MTLFVNWLVKSFSMALFGWCILKVAFATWIPPADARQNTAGLIILAAGPCTAMVFVGSYLTDGDPAYTLAQVVINDLIMLLAFAPVVILVGVLVEVPEMLTVCRRCNATKRWYEVRPSFST